MEQPICPVTSAGPEQAVLVRLGRARVTNWICLPQSR